MINFWAAWCVPCKREAPLFQEAYERYRGQVEFVGVDTADFTGDARQFLQRYGVRYPNVRDPDTQRARRLRRAPDPADVRHRPGVEGERLHLRRDARGDACAARSRRRWPRREHSLRALRSRVAGATLVEAAPVRRARERGTPRRSAHADRSKRSRGAMLPWCAKTDDRLDEASASSPAARQIENFIALAESRPATRRTRSRTAWSPTTGRRSWPRRRRKASTCSRGSAVRGPRRRSARAGGARLALEPGA